MLSSSWIQPGCIRLYWNESERHGSCLGDDNRYYRFSYILGEPHGASVRDREQSVYGNGEGRVFVNAVFHCCVFV